jgi:hypothetical protein
VNRGKTVKKEESRTIGEIMRCLAPRGTNWGSLKKWPPNVFVLTSTLLAESGAYRLAISPPTNRDWPDLPDFWSDRLVRCQAKWRRYAIGRGRVPADLNRFWKILSDAARLGVDEIDEPKRWTVAEAILCLHALADKACQGFGMPGSGGWPMSNLDEVLFSLRGKQSLDERGTLADVYPTLVRVLPKFRTPQVGITLRSLSHHLTVASSEVDISWLKSPLMPSREDGSLNILIYPFPFEVKPSDFKELRFAHLNMDSRRFGFFEFDPGRRFKADDLLKLIDAAEEKTGPIDLVVFPEQALRPADLDDIKKIYSGKKRMPLVLAGIRDRAEAGGLRRNYAELLAKDERGFREYRQSKHHRWALDSSQILQYHLGSSLIPQKKWWEGIEIAERRLHFIPLNYFITVCPLICEDLARQEPVAEVVRAVAPTLVIALLLDGPQKEFRWPSRYATVLADDPGSSVLTVTSLGMALQSRPPKREASRTIALWKDDKTGLQEIDLERGKEAVVLSVCGELKEEWTADGRSDGGTAPVLYLAGITQVGSSD